MHNSGTSDWRFNSSLVMYLGRYWNLVLEKPRQTLKLSLRFSELSLVKLLNGV